MDDNKTHQVTKVTSFVDLKKNTPDTVTMQVAYGDDLIEFEVKTLGAAQWMELDHRVAHPTKVQTGVGSSGPVYDYNDPVYQQGLRQRRDRVTLLRLAACLQVQIAGDTLEDKADWLYDNFDVGFLAAISAKLSDLHNEGEATILARRDTFQRNGHPTVAGDGDTEVDA
jgi:hypothetical protein